MSEESTGRTESEGSVGYTQITYRIECRECGAINYGDPGMDPERDKEYHRDHHCPGADFEVTDL